MAGSRYKAQSLLVQAGHWRAARGRAPYDREACAKVSETLFELYKDREPLGTAERGRLLLSMIRAGFPTARLTAAYFENLDHFFRGKEKGPLPGRVVLGLGTGRCGSTSLSAVLATVAGSCSTHENPPLINWSPDDEQVRFHMRRFKALAEFMVLVFDSSHWWLNALPQFLCDFPDGKIIGLCREPEACVESFMRIKGNGRGSINHWAPAENRIWVKHFYDPTYPTYALPDNSDKDPDAAKRELLRSYVREYNARLAALHDRMPKKVMLIRTEELNEPMQQQKIFDFVGLQGRVSAITLNFRKIGDGAVDAYRF